MAGWAAFSIAATLAVLLALNSHLAVFVLGACTGVLMTMSLTFTDVIDPIGRRVRSASDAEEWTSQQLRRLRRAGCRVVDNLHFHSGDVDHVVVGPSGVIVIETKSSDAEWHYLQNKRLRDWTCQVHAAGNRVRALIKQRTGLELTPQLVLAVWAPDAPDEPMHLADGTTVIRGIKVRDVVRIEPSRELAPDAVRQIADALDLAAVSFDAANGIVHDGFARRLIPVD